MSRNPIEDLRKVQHDMGVELLRFARLIDNFECQLMDAKDSLVRLRATQLAANSLVEAIAIGQENAHV